MPGRRLAPAVCGVVLLAILAAVPARSAPVHVQAVNVAAPAWLDRLNNWRSATGLSPLAENTTWDVGDFNHAIYMVKNNVISHSETPGAPYYTASGALEAQKSNIEVSSSTSAPDTGAIDWWMAAPFHAMGMMDPRLTSTGFGAYADASAPGWKKAWALDVIQGNSFTGGSYPVYFPGNGSTEPLTNYSGNEYPDPLAACPGYSLPTGLPVFVQVGGFTETAAAATTIIRTSDAASLPLCTIDTRYAPTHDMLYDRGGVIIIPRQPLQTGQHYQVSTTVNGVPRTWGFTVGALSARPGPPQNLTAVAGDTTATITWTAPATDGGAAISSYTVTPHVGTVAQTPVVVTAPATTTTLTGLADGTTYWFTVAATNTNGTGPAATSYSVTPTSPAAPPARASATSLTQYSLPNSDGVSWQDMDATNLSLSVTPSADTMAVVTGNADLWTQSAGYNQDLGIWMSPSSAAGGVVAWKESGGKGGTFSPNAAAVEAVVPLTHGVTYSFKLDWKTNVPALGATIWAGAGPLPVGGTNSPSRLSVQLVPAASVAAAVSTQQYGLANSDGTTWQTMDATNLVATVSPSSNQTALVTANADLFTVKSGFNQDLGIFVSVNGGADQLVAWKESGGSAGTYSPNAAFAQGGMAVSSGSTYVFKLKWKTNRSAPGAAIYAGAGPLGAGYSPTRLTVELVASTAAWQATTASQPRLAGSDGASWAPMDPSELQITITPSASESVVLGANADLWTANAGYNQDLAIFVSVNGGVDQLVAWKESGGLSGTFSPNAAYVLAVYALSSGSTYVFKLKWKTNKPAAGATIYAGAGPWGSGYSPTSLIAQVLT